MPRSSKWSLSFRFPQQEPVHVSLLSIFVPHPVHLILLDVTTLTFRHHASYICDRRTATPQSTLFMYLVNKYI